jgi:hypothetical protein
MKSLRPFLIATAVCMVSSTATLAQNNVDTTSLKVIKRMDVDTLGPRWTTSGVFTINLTQVSLSNWAAGGFSSVSGITMFNGQANWQSGRKAWDNTLVLAFGGQRQQDGPTVKTEDRVEALSKYGYRLNNAWYLAGLAQFRTQFTEGFDADGRRISHFMAPGYVIGGVGMDYRPNERFTLFMSPATARLIVVQDELLWDVSDDPEYRVYGVVRGNTTELEFGGFVRLQFTTELAKNITFTTRGDVFSNYLRNPGNLDVNWETLWGFKVNEWFSATLNTVLIYDHDVLLPKTDAEGNIYTGPATQFKQTLGIGLTFKL